MSSHHFVKDGQEPALIIEGFTQPHQVHDLLEWAPQVIVFEKALPAMQLLGIKADVVFADPASLDAIASQLEYQMPVTILPSPEEAMLCKAFDLLVELGQRYVCVTVNRLQNHFELSAPYLGRLEINFFEENMKWSSVVSRKFEKWMPSGATFFVSTASNFRVDGPAEQLNENSVRTLSDSLIAIHCEAPFWVGEPLQ